MGDINFGHCRDIREMIELIKFRHQTTVMYHSNLWEFRKRFGIIIIKFLLTKVHTFFKCGNFKVYKSLYFKKSEILLKNQTFISYKM